MRREFAAVALLRVQTDSLLSDLSQIDTHGLQSSLYEHGGQETIERLLSTAPRVFDQPWQRIDKSGCQCRAVADFKA